MPLLPNGDWVPGPNDYHIEPTGQIAAGLGADEPDQKQRRKIASGAEARLQQLKVEIAAESEKIDAKAQTLAEREATLAQREAELDARERGTKKSKPAKPDTDPASPEE